DRALQLPILIDEVPDSRRMRTTAAVDRGQSRRQRRTQEIPVAFRNVIEYARQVFNSFARSTPRQINRHPLPALTAPQHTNPSRNGPRVYRPACAELGDAAAASAAGLNALWRSRLLTELQGARERR